jgi:hypothetical protein
VSQVAILRYQLFAATVSERSGFTEHLPHSLGVEAGSKRNTLQPVVALFQHFLRLLDVIRDNRQLEQVIGEADNVGCLKIHASLGELGCHRS